MASSVSSAPHALPPEQVWSVTEIAWVGGQRELGALLDPRGPPTTHPLHLREVQTCRLPSDVCAGLNPTGEASHVQRKAPEVVFSFSNGKTCVLFS